MKSKIYLLILIPTIILCTITFAKKRIIADENIASLSIGDYKINAEVAHNDSLRTHGLMFRKSIKSNQGMLFKYKTSKLHCMWMKNTIIPLSVAFINKNHRIINIQQMKPNDETPHCSKLPSKYALEMKSGWFKKNKILPGQKVYGINK
jgi:hypothetical protein